MRMYRGYQLVRRRDRRYARWLIVGQDGWTIAHANTIREAQERIDQLIREEGG